MISKQLVSCILAASIALLGLAACGADSAASTCQALCDRTAACEKVEESAADCKTKCEESFAMAHSMNCGDQYEAVMRCALSQDVCSNLAHSCQQQVEAYFDCYCASHPEETICRVR